MGCRAGSPGPVRGPGRAPFVSPATCAFLSDALRDDRRVSESGPGILHARALEEDSHQIRRTSRQRGWKKPVDSPVKRVVAFDEDPSVPLIWPGDMDDSGGIYYSSGHHCTASRQPTDLPTVAAEDGRII